MSADAVHFSSATCEWPTPRAFFDRLDAEFAFTLDPCATDDNAKCATYYTAAVDGLTMPWHGSVFCNPPYGRALAAWVEKAYRESRTPGTTVVMLIPARTDTVYWHDFVMSAAEIRLLRGRLHFEGSALKGHNAPFPSAVVVFRSDSEGPPTIRSFDR